MDNVVKFPAAPKWSSASTVDAETLDRLIATGYLRRNQRHNWCAIEMAMNNVLVAALYEANPDLDLQQVILHVLRQLQADGRGMVGKKGGGYD
jgi:hypothetical protein